jgi:hypothetical protein
MPLLKGRWATNAMDDSAYLVSIRNILLSKRGGRRIFSKGGSSVSACNQEPIPELAKEPMVVQQAIGVRP